jgi:hypothetical protein
MLIKSEEIWPNFFIVGARKRGTTLLYFYLNKIPGVYMSSIKEPVYFAFFRWLRARNIKFYKILGLLPGSVVKSLPEKVLFKKTQKPKIDPKAVKFLQEIYHDDVLKLESLLGRSLPWAAVLGNKNKPWQDFHA